MYKPVKSQEQPEKSENVYLKWKERKMENAYSKSA